MHTIVFSVVGVTGLLKPPLLTMISWTAQSQAEINSTIEDRIVSTKDKLNSCQYELLWT